MICFGQVIAAMIDAAFGEVTSVALPHGVTFTRQNIGEGWVEI